MLRKCLKTIINEGLVSFFHKAKLSIKNRIRRKIESRRINLKDKSSKPVLKDRTQEIYSKTIFRKHYDLPFLDIIIVTYNSKDHIHNCIKSIQCSEYPKEKISIIIVDNNSSDNTGAVVENIHFNEYKNIFIPLQANLGFGAANNIGFRHSTNKYVLFLNPDTELKKDTISCLVESALESEQYGFCAWEARQQPYEHPKLYDPVTLETEWISGACFLVLREVFEMIGGFDENIFLYGEDVDLSWRLRGNGYKLKYVPRAVVMHFTYADETTIKPTQFVYSIISNGILRFKFGTIRDVILYYLNIMPILLNPPQIQNIRWKLLKNIFFMTFSIKKVLAWRTFRRRLNDFSPRFEEWGYEIRRRGDFYRNKLTKEEPLVSIIIRTKNRNHYLREALHSVWNQTYRPIEVIVVEDGPSFSKDVINQFKDLDIHYIVAGEHVGRCHAGNIGLGKATGKYINFLDDDDLFFADHVEVLIGELENDSFCRMAAYSIGLEVPTKIISTDPLKYEEIAYRTVYDKSFDRDYLKEVNYIPINCMAFNRELFLKEGGFDESLDLLEDWDLWIRYSNYTDFIFIDKTTCIYRVPGSQELFKMREDLMLKAYNNVVRRNN